MTHHTINHDEVLDLLDQLMQPAGDCRVLRLLGQAKMGKSHFMTKVFPGLAAQTYQAHCAIVDLGRQPSVPDILGALCAQLGGVGVFPTYHHAYQDWLHAPTIQVSGLQALFSKISLRAQEAPDEREKRLRHLTDQFAADLTALADHPLLLLFDAIDKAEDSLQRWLMDTLLVRVKPLAQVRAIVAGRTVPEAEASYAAGCLSYELTPVIDTAAYIHYCHQIKATLPEQSIRDFAHATQYKPGFFAELIFNHMQGGQHV